MKGGMYEYMTISTSEAKCQNSNTRDSLLDPGCVGWSAWSAKRGFTDCFIGDIARPL